VSERVAFYAISSNLVIYLTTVLREDISVSARNVNNWSGTTFMTPLIGAFIADAYLGRYLTLATFSCGYFLVSMDLVSSTINENTAFTSIDLRSNTAYISFQPNRVLQCQISSPLHVT
jgi:dipeptide/tripeptide permease